MVSRRGTSSDYFRYSSTATRISSRSRRGSWQISRADTERNCFFSAECWPGPGKSSLNLECGQVLGGAPKPGDASDANAKDCEKKEQNDGVEPAAKANKIEHSEVMSH